LQHIVVPEAQHTKSLRPQPCISYEVFLAVGMLAAVDFHHYARGEADEIEHIRSQRGLAAEMYAELMRTHPAPQFPFCIRHVVAELAGDLG
jgi:hypothetical protein